MPKISVAMPVYNGEKYIKETIESVLNQTFSDFEFIIVDDGSTDDTFNIVHSFNDTRIKYFKNEKNSGISYSLNRALEIASSEYIARIDADDICYNNRFQIQYDFLESNKNVGVCSANTDTIDANGTKIGTTKNFITSEECKLKLLFANSLSHPAAMFRKNMVLQVGGYSLGMEPIEDFELWVRMTNICEIQNIENTLVKYRVHALHASAVFGKNIHQALVRTFDKKNRLYQIIDDEFLDFHIRGFNGFWNGKISLGQILKFSKWKTSLLRNNAVMRVFDQDKLRQEINSHLVSVALSIIRKKDTPLVVRIVAMYYYLLRFLA